MRSANGHKPLMQGDRCGPPSLMLLCQLRRHVIQRGYMQQCKAALRITRIHRRPLLLLQLLLQSKPTSLQGVHAAVGNMTRMMAPLTTPSSERPTFRGFCRLQVADWLKRFTRTAINHLLRHYLLPFHLACGDRSIVRWSAWNG